MTKNKKQKIRNWRRTLCDTRADFAAREDAQQRLLRLDYAPTDFGQWLQRQLDLGMTSAAELCAAAKVSSSTVSGILRSTQTPSVDLARRLCWSIGRSLGEWERSLSD